MADTVRYYYTRLFTAGPLNGLSVCASLTLPDDEAHRAKYARALAIGVKLGYGVHPFTITDAGFQKYCRRACCN